MINIGVVLVTYNRLDKLKKSLECYDTQTYLPKYVLVVNNASTDGTKEFLQQWINDKKSYSKMVLECTNNTGGSGGFYKGLKKSLDYDADWIWVADDDVYTDRKAFEICNSFIEEHDYNNEISAIGSKVLVNGCIDRGHRRHLEEDKRYPTEISSKEEEYNQEYFNIDIISFAGSLIRQEAIKEVGLPEKDFFIWFDDMEYSLRLRKVGKIYCVPAIEIDHDVEQQYGGDNITWKDYYGLRNEVYTFKKHFSKGVFISKVIRKAIKSVLMLFRKESREKAKLFFPAIVDGARGKLGIHRKYKPGWKPVI